MRWVFSRLLRLFGVDQSWDNNPDGLGMEAQTGSVNQGFFKGFWGPDSGPYNWKSGPYNQRKLSSGP